MSPPPYPCSPPALDLDPWPPIVYTLLAQESRKQGVPALVEPYFRMLATVFNSASFIIDELCRAGRDQSTRVWEFSRYDADNAALTFGRFS